VTATEGIALAGIVLSGLLGFLSYRIAKEGRDDARPPVRLTAPGARLTA
jgi:hypothetical protein